MKIISILLANLILFISCTNESIFLDRKKITEWNNSKLSNNTYYGCIEKDEDLIRSIIFFDGNFTKMIPSLVQLNEGLNHLNEINHADFRITQNKFITDLKLRDPEFLLNFNNTILLGNANDIKDVISKTQLQIMEFVKNELKEDGIIIDNTDFIYSNDSSSLSNLLADYENDYEVQGLSCLLFVFAAAVYFAVYTRNVNWNKNFDVFHPSGQEYYMAFLKPIEVDKYLSELMYIRKYIETY